MNNFVSTVIENMSYGQFTLAKNTRNFLNCRPLERPLELNNLFNNKMFALLLEEDNSLKPLVETFYIKKWV